MKFKKQIIKKILILRDKYKNFIINQTHSFHLIIKNMFYYIINEKIYII